MLEYYTNFHIITVLSRPCNTQFDIIHKIYCLSPIQSLTLDERITSSQVILANDQEFLSRIPQNF